MKRYKMVTIMKDKLDYFILSNTGQYYVIGLQLRRRLCSDYI